jgi:hypothetical protein
MGDVLQFTPRPKTAAPEDLRPLAGADLRASLEEAAQTAFDAADRIIAVLDRLDGDADHEEIGDAEPSLAAPENQGSQVTWLRGNDQDREAEVPETVLPEVAAEPQPVAEILPWRGRGNVIEAAGTALLDLVGGLSVRRRVPLRSEMGTRPSTRPDSPIEPSSGSLLPCKHPSSKPKHGCAGAKGSGYQGDQRMMRPQKHSGSRANC